MKLRKFTALLLVALMIASIMPVAVAQATPNVGDRIGDVLHTDIRVFINGIPIMGYNIDGWTYVIAEDLAAYGLSVVWNPAGHGTLSITRGSGQSSMQPRPVPANTMPSGTVAFPYVHTNIVTDINGRVVNSYNIQGFTVVRIDDVVAAFGSQRWLSAESMLLVSLIPGQEPLRPILPPQLFFSAVPHFEGSNTHLSSRSMLGVTYQNTWTPDTGMGVVWGLQASGWRHHNLNGQFTVLTGTIGRIDGTGSNPSTIRFIGDGRELATFTVQGDTHPTNISVDVTGITILRIEISQPNQPARLGFTDAMIQ